MKAKRCFSAKQEFYICFAVTVWTSIGFVVVTVAFSLVFPEGLHHRCLIVRFAEGIPEMHGCYEDGEYCVMVMELLGASLSDILLEYEMTLKAVLVLADQMVCLRSSIMPRLATCSSRLCSLSGRSQIQHLEYVHSKNIIHGDLKPSNFLIGRGDKRHKIFIIDFGLCEEYRNPETKVRSLLCFCFFFSFFSCFFFFLLFADAAAEAYSLQRQARLPRHPALLFPACT